MFQGGDGVSKILWLGSIPRVLANKVCLLQSELYHLSGEEV